MQRDWQSLLATAGGLLAIVLWSGTFALARSLSEKVGPLTAGVAAYLIGAACSALVSFPAARNRSQASRFSRKYLFGCGLLFTCYTLLIYFSVGLSRTHEELLEVALVNYLWPASTIILSLILLNKRLRPLLWP